MPSWWHDPRVSRVGEPPAESGSADDGVRAYVDTIAPEHRPLFDRMSRLVQEAAPAARLRLAYSMPTYVLGKRKLSLGVWRHGLSVYGWGENRDGGFVARHPELRTSKGTIQLRPEQAEVISDDELRALAAAVLAD